MDEVVTLADLVVPALRSRHYQIVRYLGLRIVRGRINGASQTLPSEPELCAQLGVSRAMLREALKVLAAKGMVESRPKLGTVIRERRGWNLLDPEVLAWECEAGPDEWLLRNLTEMRAIVEPQAARLAAERATGDDVLALDACLRRMQAAVRDVPAFVTADQHFHLAVLGAAHNDLLLQLMQSVGTALQASVNMTARLAGATDASVVTHAKVVEAVRARDGAGAEAAMREILAMTARDIERSPRQRPASDEIL